MKYLKVYFKNWIGIYLGLGLTDLELDFTKCKHRLCLIVGTNGSGKSTIMEGLTLFPEIYSNNRDSNDFIMVDTNGNRDGMRYIYFSHNGEYYISRIQWLDKITKCYLFKSNEKEEEIQDLNPNGNVRSYKEQLEILFGLSDDIGKVLFLGPGLKDIVTMNPFERKNNISKFTPNIDKYLSLFKNSAKYHSRLKRDLTVITTELHKLGDDKEKIIAYRDGCKDKYNKTLENLQMLKTVQNNTNNTINVLNIKGVPIQTVFDNMVNEYNTLCNQLNNLNLSYKDYCNKLNISSNMNETYYENLIIDYRDKYSKYNFQIENFETRKNELLNSKVNYESMLNNHTAIHNQYIQSNNPEKFICEITKLNEEIDEIKNTISSLYKELNLNDNYEILFDKDDANKYLIFSDNLTERIDNLKYYYNDYNIITKYLDNTLTNIDDTLDNKYIELNDLKTQKEELQKNIGVYESNKDIISLLNDIPSNCNNSSCPFIIKAKSLTKSDIIELKNSLLKINTNISNIESDISSSEIRCKKIMDFFKEINSIMNFINNNMDLISKFPDYKYMTDVKNIIKNLCFILPRSRKFSELSYLKSRYNEIQNKILEIQNTMQKSSDYYNIIKKQLEDIDSIKNSLLNIEQKLEHHININKDILNDWNLLKNKMDIISNIITIRKNLVDGLKRYEILKNNISKLKKHYSASCYFNSRLNELNTKIKETNDTLINYEQELNLSEYNLRRFDEFTFTKNKLEKEYELLDILRKCWSPTTGIPLIFMKGFMDNLICDANRYLEEIWGGKSFLISNFCIDDKSFYILINRNDDYICKDASQCSGAERAMLCTVLSLALLKQFPHAENMFNIARFDEIDGTLDYERRRVFLGILMNLLNNIGSEQSFIISHSDTFQSDVDVILLKGSEDYEQRILNNNYNIIYRY